MAEGSIPKSTYWKVFAALMVLLFLTVFVAYIHLDPTLAIIIAMVIAVVKAVLVILYFMHVKINSRLTQLFVVTGFIFLIIMIGITLTDYKTRSWEKGSGGYQEYVDTYTSPYGIPSSMLPQHLPGADPHGNPEADAPELDEVGE